MFQGKQTKDQLVKELTELKSKLAEAEQTAAQSRIRLSELERLQSKLKGLVDTLPVAVFMCDETRKILSVNKTALELVAIAEADLIGRQIDALFAPWDSDQQSAIAQKLLSEGSVVFEHVLVSSAQQELPVEITIQSLVNEGEPELHYFIRDISQRRVIETDLRWQRDFFSAVLGTAGALIIVLDGEGRIVQFNRACEWITGYSFSEIEDRLLWEVLLIPEEVPQVQAVFEQLRSGDFPSEFENHWMTKDGRRRLIVWSNTALVNPKGQVEFIVGTGIDVTERRRAEEELRKSEKRYRQLIHNLREGVWVLDAEGYTSFVNDRMAEILGYSAEYMRGKHFYDFMDARGRELSQYNAELRRQGRREPLDYEFIRANTELIHANIALSPITSKDGADLGTFCVVMDVTERVRAQHNLAWEADLNATMAELANSLIARNSLDMISTLIMSHAKRLTASKFGLVGFIDERRGVLVSPAFSKEALPTCQLADDSYVFHKVEGLLGWVMQHRKSLIVNQVAEDQRAKGVPAGHIPIQRYLAAPACLGEELVGQIALANASRDYTSQDLNVVERLASLYALAIQQHRGEQAQQLLTAQLADRVRELRCLYDISRLAAQQAISLEALLTGSAGLIPQGWANPESVFARIVANGRHYTASKFEVTSQKIVRELVVQGESIGSLEIFYAEAARPADNPFSPTDEEQNLVSAIAELLDKTIELKRAEEQLRLQSAALQSTASAILITNQQGNITYVNPAFTKLTGYSFDEVKGKNPRILQSGRHQIEVYHELWRQISEGKVWHGEILNKRKDGVIYHEEMIVTPVVDKDQAITHFIAVKQDITERKQAEDALQQALTESQTVSQRLSRMVKELERRAQETGLLNEMGDLLQVCNRFEEAYAVIGKYMQRFFPDDSGALGMLTSSGDIVEIVASWGKNRLHEEVFDATSCWALRSGRQHNESTSEGASLCNHVRAGLNADVLCIPLMAQGEGLGILHVQFSADLTGLAKSWDGDELRLVMDSKKHLVKSIGERIGLSLANLRLRERLHEQAIIDPLTGLFNRRYLQSILEREVRRAVRSKTALAVIMADIDHFKTFNDRFGHAVGDLVLHDVAKFLKTSVRTEDFVCRYGGEEFLIIMPMATVCEAQQRAEQIRSKIEVQSFAVGQQRHERLTLSLGVAALSAESNSAESLLHKADDALYRAKHAGRNQVICAEPNAADCSGVE